MGVGGRALAHGVRPCSAPQLALEEPLETAVLLSLAGVRSLVANQWPTLLRDNALRAGVLWDSEWVSCGPLPRRARGAAPPLSPGLSPDLLAAGEPIGMVVRALQTTEAGGVAEHGNRRRPLPVRPAATWRPPSPRDPCPHSAPAGCGAQTLKPPTGRAPREAWHPCSRDLVFKTVQVAQVLEAQGPCVPVPTSVETGGHCEVQRWVRGGIGLTQRGSSQDA